MPKPTGRVGKVTYIVMVQDPIGYPALEFRRKKDAVEFIRLLKSSVTMFGMVVDADILKQEVSEEGFHL